VHAEELTESHFITEQPNKQRHCYCSQVSDLRASGLVHPPPHSAPSLAASDAGKENQRKENWWEQLTREQWLSHLNKLKLSESMLESLPQVNANNAFYLKFCLVSSLICSYEQGLISSLATKGVYKGVGVKTPL